MMMRAMAWNGTRVGKQIKLEGSYNNKSILADRHMKGLTKLRPLGRLGGREKTRYGQLGMKSKHGDESDSEDSDFAREDLDYQSGLLRHISFYQTKLSFLSLFMYEVPADQIFF